MCEFYYSLPKRSLSVCLPRLGSHALSPFRDVSNKRAALSPGKTAAVSHNLARLTKVVFVPWRSEVLSWLLASLFTSLGAPQSFGAC